MILGTRSAAAENSDLRKENPQTEGSGEGSSPLAEVKGLAPKYWIDPSIAGWPAGPMRKVHIEYHTSKHTLRLAERFNADEFADQLVRAHVTGATVFAKDMYGYSYYPSKVGPAHPKLGFDLLGEQVTALRKRKIQVLAYYMTTWNPELADRHPEWLVVQQPGAKSRPPVDDVSADQKAFKGGITPEVRRSKDQTASGARAETSFEDKAYRAYLWKFCLGQEGFVQGELDHIREIVSKYEIDALWIDGDGPSTCYCDECIRQLRERRLDPFNGGVQHDHKVGLNYSFLKRIHDLVKEVRPRCLVCPQNQGSFGLRKRAPLIDYTDHEALFTDAQHYGYHYFGAMIRYARGFGVPVYGLTVCFKDFWADFGGLKNPTQLRTELAEYISQGARCDIGDQMHPNGQLDPAVYHVIGKVYGQLEKLEPFLQEAVPVTEAALLTGGGELGMPCNELNYGWVKLLTECCVQFDIVEPGAEWEERYGLIILPDDFSVDQALANRLHLFIAKGGSVIATDRAGVFSGTEKTWLERYGFQYDGISPFTPAYMVVPENFIADMPGYAYALYEGASQWRVSAPGSVLTALGEPLYQRSPEHYMSHQQTPFDHVTSYAALARNGNVGLVAFPIGRGYYQQGFWIYREAFRKLLNGLRPTPLIQTDAHASTALSLTHQAAKPEIGRNERYLVHIINYSPVRKTPKHTDFYEDPVPLRDVTVRLNLPLKNAKARALDGGHEIPVRRTSGGGAEVIVPRVNVHELVCFENSM